MRNVETINKKATKEEYSERREQPQKYANMTPMLTSLGVDALTVVLLTIGTTVFWKYAIYILIYVYLRLFINIFVYQYLSNLANVIDEDEHGVLFFAMNAQDKSRYNSVDISDVKKFRMLVIFTTAMLAALQIVYAGAEYIKDPISRDTKLLNGSELHLPSYCGDVRMLWSGSRSVILECNHKIIILHSPGGLISIVAPPSEKSSAANGISFTNNSAPSAQQSSSPSSLEVSDLPVNRSSSATKTH